MKIMYFVLYLVSAALLIFYLKSSFSFSFYLSGIALLISEKLYESCLVELFELQFRELCL